MSRYATKTDLEHITHVYASRFALKSSLTSLKTELDKFDIRKLVPVPVDLSRLSDVVKMMLLKKLRTINYFKK